MTDEQYKLNVVIREHWYAELQKARAEVAALRELVRHCWVHSAYRDCGFDQMTTEQKELYRTIIGDGPEDTLLG